MSVTLHGIRGVVFDLDDTLYPECEYAASGLAAVGEWLQGQIACPCDPGVRLIDLFRSGRRHRLFDELLAEWGVDSARDLIPGMVACYREHTPSIRLHADAERAIGRWHGNFRLGLITDGPLVSQRHKIEALGLASRLDLILCTDEWGPDYWKPHPRAFSRVEEVWQMAGRNCVYFADNPAKDFVAPNQLGWASVQVIRVPSEYSNVPAAAGGEPQLTVSSMDEVELTS